MKTISRSLKCQMVVPLMIVVFLLCFAMPAMAFPKLASQKYGEIGSDRVPYDLFIFNKQKTFSSLNDWIDQNIGNLDGEAAYLMPESFTTFEVNGEEAVAFKRWEYDGYTQYLLIANGRRLKLYSTPHVEISQDGFVVFKKLFDIVIPETQSTTEFNDPSVFVDTPVKEERAIYAIEPLATCSSTTKCSNDVSTGDYNGVPAYSNGENSGTTKYCGTNSYGYRWQCVEYVVRYYSLKKGMNLKGTGNANSYCSNGPSKGLTRRFNCDPNNPNVPYPGDIIASNSGHVAIVKAVGSNYVTVIDQNFSRCSGVRNISMTRKKNSKGQEYACVSGFSSSYPVSCWMWK